MSAPTGTEWTRDEQARIRRLHKQGLSAGEIARKIGGRSRNAVVACLWRLNGVKPKRSPSVVVIDPPEVRNFVPPPAIRDTRRPFARMMGDPLPGRSALDLSRVKAVCGKPGIAGKTRSVAPTGREQDYLEDRHSNSEAVV